MFENLIFKIKIFVFALPLLAAMTASDAFSAQAYVSSATELNSAIGNAVSGDTITVTQDFAADADIAVIDALDITISADGAAERFLSGGGAYKGFNITNSTAAINGVNLSDFRNNTAGYVDSYGGAIYSKNSTVSYSGDNIIFSGNTSSSKESSSGGAIYSDSSSFVFDSPGNIGFYSNTSHADSISYWIYSYGGAIAASGAGSLFSFRGGGDINFFSNTVYESDKYNYNLGHSYAYGGAIYAKDGNSFSFSGLGNINFSSNTSYSYSYGSGSQAYGYGGAIYASTKNSFDFDSSGNIIFSSNTAYGFADSSGSGFGGAIYASGLNSFVFRSLGNIDFSNNLAHGSSSGRGGAVYAENQNSFSFDGYGDIVFSNNSAFCGVFGFGGAIYAGSNNSFAFNGSGNIIFLNNSALSDSYGFGYGGAIYAYGQNSFSFAGSGDIVFSNNSASCLGNGYGGAIYAADQNSFAFDGSRDIVFSNNSASGGSDGRGGAICADGAYANTNYFSFTGSGSIMFSNNTASGSTIGLGGAISAANSMFVFNAPALTFTNNSASGLGGAFFMAWGSETTFNASNSDMNIIFKENYANGRLNDIYLSSVYYYNGDAVYGHAAALNFDAEGWDIILPNGIKADGDGSGAVNKTGDGNLIFGGETIIENAAFNITGGGIKFLDNASFTGPSMVLPGTTLDMHSAGANNVNLSGNFQSYTNLKMDVFSDGTNDQITAATAGIDGNIDIFAGLGVYNGKEFDLIITGGAGSLTGEFASASISNKGLKYEIKYEDGIVKLIVNGAVVSDFGSLSPLTYNQAQTAAAFDKISANPGAWEETLNKMMLKQYGGSESEISEIKDFLAKTSGYFLANVIRNFAADGPNNEVYDKIRRQSEEWGVKSGDTATDNGSGLWVQVKGALESFKKDENSLEDYTDTAMGVMFGFDRFLEDKLWNGDLMWGAYARIDKDRIEQGNSKADGNKNGLGLYGGYIKDGWELKAMLLGSYDRFSTERAAYSGAIAKADINGVTVSADAEAALKIGIIQNLKLRPYAGVEIANTKYGGFKESGAGIYNLDTRSGNYLRTAGRAGVGLDYEKGIWIWYANAEGKYVIDGTKPEVKSQFADTGIDFYSRGAEEGRIQIGAGAGGEVRIAKDWKLFANAKYYTAERYENISGNAGLRYVFGKKQYTSEQTRLQKAEEALMEREAKQKEAEGKRRNEAIIKKEVDEIVAEEVMQAEARRMAEEARITKEISDAELAKKKSEAEARRKRPMLKTYTLTTHFKTDMYFLTEEFKRQLWAIAEELKEYEYNMITIEGHTDSTGTSEWNKKLSRQRAKSVYDELIRAGVDVNKIEYQGYSYTMPVASNKTAEGRAENRRTEVFVE